MVQKTGERRLIGKVLNKVLRRDVAGSGWGTTGRLCGYIVIFIRQKRPGGKSLNLI
jgi:hypothetical protein